MPFKSAESYRQWNFRYQRARAERENHSRVRLEEQIIEAVAAAPCEHDIPSLYALFRGDDIPLPAITRVTNGLLRGGLFYWDVQRGKNSACHRSGLALTNRAKEIFAPPAGRPEEDRADDHTEGPGEHWKP